MRKQSGFTLIELMVVMAIIAILATAGLSAYGGYLKKARDSTRISDMRAIQSTVLGSLSISGTAPLLNDLKKNLSAMNNGILLIDPMDTKTLCLDIDGDPVGECNYRYSKCNDGGYVLRVRFESKSNYPRYLQDDLNTGSGAGDGSYYDLGNCDSPLGGDEGPIRLPIT